LALLRVTPSVPDVVIGEPDTDMMAGTVMATDVTVPVVGVAHFTPKDCVLSAVNTWPLLPTGTRSLPVSYPKMSPLVVRGDRAANAAEAVVCPVPPLAIGRAVPDRDTAKVPEVVTGDPDTERKDGTVMATDVTVPVVGVAHLRPNACVESAVST
jgi:hypothetical protein